MLLRGLGRLLGCGWLFLGLWGPYVPALGVQQRKPHQHFGYTEGRLEAGRVSHRYKLYLQQGLQLFADWLRVQPATLDALAHDPDRISQALVDFLDFAHDSNILLWRARHALLGVQTRWRFLRHKLPRPWDAIRGWQAEKVWGNRLPLLIEIMRAMFLVAVSWGAETSPEWPYMFPFAVLLRVGFWCLLRPRELANLRRADVRLAWRSHKLSAVLAVRDPKNRMFLGRAQFAVLHSGSAARWLEWLCCGVEPGLKLWPSSQHAFNIYFTAVLSRLELGRFNMRAGSIRPGGATEFFMRHQNVAFLKYQGRWKSDSSLAVYIQEAMAHLVWVDLSAAEQSRLEHLAWEGRQAWRSPPVDSWSGFFSRGRQWATQPVALSSCFERQAQLCALPGKRPISKAVSTISSTKVMIPLAA